MWPKYVVRTARQEFPAGYGLCLVVSVRERSTTNVRSGIPRLSAAVTSAGSCHLAPTVALLMSSPPPCDLYAHGWTLGQTGAELGVHGARSASSSKAPASPRVAAVLLNIPPTQQILELRDKRPDLE
jgi:hypothetical protein